MKSSTKHRDLLNSKRVAELLFRFEEFDIDSFDEFFPKTSTKLYCDAFEITDVIVPFALCNL